MDEKYSIVNGKLISKAHIKPNEKIAIVAISFFENNLCKTEVSQALTFLKESNCKVIVDQSIYWLQSKTAINPKTVLSVSKHSIPF